MRMMALAMAYTLAKEHNEGKVLIWTLNYG